MRIPAEYRGRVWSTWDWGRLHYHYWLVPGPPNAGGWRRLGGLGVQGGPVREDLLGISLDDALPELPTGAKWIGTGDKAVGTIARALRQPGMPAPTTSGTRKYPVLEGLGFVGEGVEALLSPITSYIESKPLQAAVGAILIGISIGRVSKVSWPTTTLASLAVLILGYQIGKMGRSPVPQIPAAAATTNSPSLPLPTQPVVVLPPGSKLPPTKQAGVGRWGLRW